MKNLKFTNTKLAFTIGCFLIALTSCERDISDEVEFATFPVTADIYTDAPVGLTDEFFVSFDPAAGANTEGFGTDDVVAYEGTSSIRIDVPASNDPNGGFIGGIFLDRGSGRDLTGYNALTFWAKGSTTATVGTFGFGTDFQADKFPVSISGTQLSTDWKQYTIPIPDASKLIQERGMFLFSAGSDSTGGQGFTFWMDEIRFENLGTLGQPQPSIFNGIDVEQEGFIGVPVELTDLTYSINSGSGENITVNAAPHYYDFVSSDPNVAFVNEMGIVTIIGTGTSTITASINNVAAEGSLTLNVNGSFTFAPEPTRDAASVISLFSDAYTDVPVSRYNSFFEPFQTTLGGDIPVGSESIISYTNLNFVGIVFNDVIFPAEAVPTVDATAMTHLHIDINVQEALQGSDTLLLELTNYGGTNTVGSYTISGADLATNTWVSFDIPLTDFAGLSDRSDLGMILFNSSDPSNTPTISELFLDNIYFYTE